MCNLIPECVEAGQVWRIQNLIEDLGKKKSGKKELEDWEKRYLCLLLNNNKPRDIADKLNYSRQSLNVSLSKKNGLYRCFSKLTGKKVEHWKDIIIYSIDKYYTGKNDAQNQLIILTIPLNDLSKEQIIQLEKTLREIAGIKQLIGIDEGSMILIFDGNPEACQRVETLFKENQLSVLLGVPIANVQIMNPPKTKSIIDLNQWFHGFFDLGWQPLDQLILSPNIRFSPEFEKSSNSNSISRSKKIQLKNHELVLVVRITKLEIEDVNIKAWLYLTKTDSTNRYLPFSIQLMVKDENGQTMEKQAGESDIWLKLEFNVKPEEQFSISVLLSDTSTNENFMI